MFDELGDRVFRRRYDSLRLNIGVVVGDEGVLIVDTRESHVAGDELAEDLTSLTSVPVRWIVNTHHHWDHTFGNAVFGEAVIWGHVRCRDTLLEKPDQGRESAMRWLPPERHHELDPLEIRPPTETITAVGEVDVGGMVVQLSHHGRAHTDNDVIVTAGGVSFMGDLIEEGVAPNMGDAFLSEWPATLRASRSVAGPVMVPGHGDVMGADQVDQQTADLELVAELLHQVLYEDRALEDAIHAGPFLADDMRAGLARGMAAAKGV